MLKPGFYPEIPEETVKVAKAAFPKGNMYLSLRDALEPIFEDDTFQDLYPALGQPAESPGRLALITVMQYVENLSDRQAAEAGLTGSICWGSVWKIQALAFLSGANFGNVCYQASQKRCCWKSCWSVAR